MSGGRVVVVGAGVLGCAIGAALAQDGWQVEVVDALGAVGHGSTSASLGILRFHASDRQLVALSVAGARAWRDPRSWLGDVATDGFLDVRTTGSLVLDLGGGYTDVVRGLYDELGVPYEYLDADRLARRMSWLDLGRYAGDDGLRDTAVEQLPGGLLTPQACYVVDPAGSVVPIARAVVARGGSLRLGTPVRAVHRAGGRAAGVRLADGTLLPADVVVLALGPHAAGFLAREHLVDDWGVGIGPVRHEMFRLPLAGTARGALCHLADDDLGINLRPEGDDALYVGIQQPAGTVGDPAGDPEVGDPQVDRAAFEDAALRVARRVHGAGVPARAQGIAGVYDVTDDWLPVYDRTALDGCYVAVGTSGTQYKTAPTVARAMAALVAACEAGADHDRLPVRAPVLDAGELDLGAFSRLRRPVPSAHTING
ncbi:MAG TPA: FAD-dependent oxidoreductase [Cellulomonas sp.]